jgi:pyruvate kinase
LGDDISLTPPSAGKSCARVENPAAAKLLPELTRLRVEIAGEGEATLALWETALKRTEFHPAATNLAYYLALRRRDISRLQEKLSQLGLSSLGRSEARVLPAMDAIIASLAALAGEASLAHPPCQRA